MRNATSHALLNTQHATRNTHRSTFRTPHSAHRTGRAFTLVELLVVISIIVVLAAATFPAVGTAKIAMMRARAKSELAQIETAIERYKQKLGYYPPDNAPNWDLNQLYYELLGTTYSGSIYQTLDQSAQIGAAILPTTFGPNVTGFMNCNRPGGDELSGAVAFLKGLKAAQFLALPGGCTILGASLDGPLTYPNPLGSKLNPWRYNSSSPRYNPKSFDLWIDVMAGSKTNRISNWSDKPLIVSTPY
jgi:prepilin-type N-terminal cleavage/methylation domain-containing protein